MSLFIEDYSERAIALFGNSKPYKNKIMEIGGKFNPSLKVCNSDERRVGYIFPKTKRSTVEQLINEINSGNIEPEAVEEKTSTNIYTKSSSSRNSNSNSNSNSSIVEVSRTDFMNLLAKVERLEQEVNNLKQQLTGKSLPKVSPKKVEKVEELAGDVEEDEEEKEQMPKNRLLRRK